MGRGGGIFSWLYTKMVELLDRSNLVDPTGYPDSPAPKVVPVVDVTLDCNVISTRDICTDWHGSIMRQATAKRMGTSWNPGYSTSNTLPY